jgi:hypothetical protein
MSPSGSSRSLIAGRLANSRNRRFGDEVSADAHGSFTKTRPRCAVGILGSAPRRKGRYVTLRRDLGEVRMWGSKFTNKVSP